MQPGKELKHIVRIMNTDLDGKRVISYALRKIKGVGFQYANMACVFAAVDKNKRVGYLEDDEVKRLEDALKNPQKYGVADWMFNRRKDIETGKTFHLFTTDLDFTKDNDLKLLKMMKSYRGMRHQWGLPVRGQRTKSNFRKSKGKGLGVQRKKVAAPAAASEKADKKK
ncbi:30S ribosomal protein S13 [Candidatus Woesearchaeota archaeon]|nr:30S ribosomal protein S13 [Candidatus Woesearchaeota archaeon]